MKTVEQSVQLLAITPNASMLIENAGRTCYKSEDQAKGDVHSAEKFCAMLVERGHESVIEHAVATFRIVCDRGISHEIVRHRIASFSQESTRYCNYNKDKFGSEIVVITPPGIARCVQSAFMQGECDCDECVCYNAWIAANQQAEDSYNIMIKRGKAPQIARSVLPTDLKTEIVMTANFREWRHFIKMRASAAAHPQVQWIAEEIRKNLFVYSPTLFPGKA